VHGSHNRKKRLRTDAVDDTPAWTQAHLSNENDLKLHPLSATVSVAFTAIAAAAVFIFVMVLEHR